MKIKKVITIAVALPLAVNVWAKNVVVQLEMPKQEKTIEQPKIQKRAPSKKNKVLVVSKRTQKGVSKRHQRIAKRKNKPTREKKVGPGRLSSAPVDYRTLVDPDDSQVPMALPLGHEYYHMLLDKAADRKWALITSAYWSVAFKGYDDDHCLVPLSRSIFGKNVSIGDVFLLSRLMNDNLVSNLNSFAAAYTTRPLERPQAATEAFGFYRSDQYPALLASALLNLEAEQRSFCVNLGATYRFDITCSGSIQGFVGMNVPIEEQVHILDSSFKGGSLYRPIFINGVTISDNPLFVFFRQFEGMEDFVNRILMDKDLEFKTRQRRIGVGDISLFGLFDFAGLFKHMDGLQVGLNVNLPSGRKDDATTVWQPILGNGGGTEFDLFFQALFKSPSPVFNPTLRLVGGFTKKFSCVQRVGRQIANDGSENFGRSALESVANLQIPLDAFQTGYLVDAFSLFDVNVPFFADTAVPTEIKRGHRFLVSVGNYVYNFINLGFRFGAFYDFSYKRSDHLCLDADNCCPAVEDGIFDFCLLERLSRCNFHRFSWNLTYKLRNLIELNVGSSHIIAGRNTPRVNEVYCGFVAVF